MICYYLHLKLQGNEDQIQDSFQSKYQEMLIEYYSKIIYPDVSAPLNSNQRQYLRKRIKKEIYNPLLTLKQKLKDGHPEVLVQSSIASKEQLAVDPTNLQSNQLQPNDLQSNDLQSNDLQSNNLQSNDIELEDEAVHDEASKIVDSHKEASKLKIDPNLVDSHLVGLYLHFFLSELFV